MCVCAERVERRGQHPRPHVLTVRHPPLSGLDAVCSEAATACVRGVLWPVPFKLTLTVRRARAVERVGCGWGPSSEFVTPLR